MASAQIRMICISLTGPDMRIRIARNRQARERRSFSVRLFVTLRHPGHGGGSVRILRWQMAVATAWLQLP